MIGPVYVQEEIFIGAPTPTSGTGQGAGIVGAPDPATAEGVGPGCRKTR